MTIGQHFLDSVIKRFKDCKALGDMTFDQLQGDEFHFQPNGASNSIAVIIKHMHGNMLSRWANFLTEDGEKPSRNRDAEFEDGDESKEELLRLWNEGWSVCLQALEDLKEEDLTKIITIRTQPLVVVDAINRQMGHYRYHVGQIVYLGRWIRQDDWTSLSIPKGQSGQYNQDMKQSRH